MPMYEYYCKKCDKLFEKIVPKYSEFEKCKECGEESEMVISNTNFILKGPGWGADNYAKKG